MTQPDLVSKLRELLLTIKGFAMQTCNTETDMAVTLEQIRHVFYGNQESLGLEGQGAAIITDDYCKRCGRLIMRPDANYGIHPDAVCKCPSPCGPSQPETEGEAGRQPVPGNSPFVQPSPSTPIVPSTAGLSAIKVQSWANNCAVYERQHAATGDFAGVEYHRGAKEAFQRVADALLGAERPAPAGEVNHD